MQTVGHRHRHPKVARNPYLPLKFPFESLLNSPEQKLSSPSESFCTNDRINQLIKYTMLATCVLITTIRIYANYLRYSEYPVIISGRVYVSDTESLPQLSVCFQDVLDPQKLQATRPDLMNDYDNITKDGSEALFQWISETFTIKEIIALSFDYNRYFYNCSVLSKDALQRESCDYSWQVWLTARRKCYSFFRRSANNSVEASFLNNKTLEEESNKEESNKDETNSSAVLNEKQTIFTDFDFNRILLTNKIWVNIFIRKHNLHVKRKVDLLLQPAHALLSVDRSNPGLKSFSTDYTKSVYISYEKSTITRLPTPYSTRCVDYHSSGYLDRAHCLYQCETNRFVQLYASWPDTMPISVSQIQLDPLLGDLHFNYSAPEESRSRTHQAVCEKSCALLDCYHEQIKLQKKYHKLDKQRGHPTLELRLYLNSAPVTVLEYNPVYPSLNSQVQLFIGPASLWLGLSVFGIGRLMFNAAAKLIKLTQNFFSCCVRKQQSTKVAPQPLIKVSHPKLFYTDHFILQRSTSAVESIALNPLELPTYEIKQDFRLLHPIQNKCQLRAHSK